MTFYLNKAGYMAHDAPSTRLKKTGDGRMDGRADGPTDGRTDRRTDGPTDTTSYRDATAHLKNGHIRRSMGRTDGHDLL